MALILASFFLLELAAIAGVGSHNTMYVGGAVSTIKQETEGKSSADDEKVFSSKYQGGKLEIPYERMNELEYSQKADRRLGVEIVVSPIAL
jgi:hypothetical protein